MINPAEGKGVLFRELAGCLGVCENYTEEAIKGILKSQEKADKFAKSVRR